MWRTEDKVPEYYVEGSRDFQLLCNLIDLIQNHIICGKNAVDNVLDLNKSKNTVLPLLGSRIAFFHKLPLEDKYLRNIYNYFSQAIKYKGTNKVLQELQYLLNKYAQVTDYKIKNESDDGDEFKITYLADKAINMNLLNSLLQYLKPAGYNLGTEYMQQKTESYITKLKPQEEIEWLLSSGILDTARISRVRYDNSDAEGDDDDLSMANLEDIKHRVMNVVDASSVTNRQVGDVIDFHNEE